MLIILVKLFQVLVSTILFMKSDEQSIMTIMEGYDNKYLNNDGRNFFDRFKNIVTKAGFGINPNEYHELNISISSYGYYKLLLY